MQKTLWAIEGGDPTGEGPAPGDVRFRFDPADGPSPDGIEEVGPDLLPADRRRSIDRAGTDMARAVLDRIAVELDDGEREAVEGLFGAAVKAFVWHAWGSALAETLLDRVRPGTVRLIGFDAPPKHLVPDPPEGILHPPMRLHCLLRGIPFRFERASSIPRAPSPPWARARHNLPARLLERLGRGSCEGRGEILASGSLDQIGPLLDPLRREGKRLAFHEEPFPVREGFRLLRRGIRPLALRWRAAPSLPEDVVRRLEADLPGMILERSGDGLLATSAAERITVLLRSDLPRLLGRFRAYRRHLEREEIKGVLVSEEIAESRRTLVCAARAAGIPSVGLWHGMPGSFGAHLGRILCTRTAAYGAYGIERSVAENGDPPEAYAATGSPRYDALAARRTRRDEDRAALRAARGWGTSDRVVVLATQPANTPWRVGFLSLHPSPADNRRLLRGTAVAAARAGARLVVKLHPRDSRIDEARRTLAGAPDGTVDVVRDVPTAALLNGADLLVTTFSTTTVEAVLLDLPVVTVRWDGEDPHAYAEEGLALRATDETELADAVADALGDAGVRSRLAAARAARRDRFCLGYTGGAVGRVLDLLRETFGEREGVRPPAEGLRCVST